MCGSGDDEGDSDEREIAGTRDRPSQPRGVRGKGGTPGALPPRMEPALFRMPYAPLVTIFTPVAPETVTPDPMSICE